MVDDPHTGRASREMTATETLQPYDTDQFSTLHGAGASTMEPLQDLNLRMLASVPLRLMSNTQVPPWLS